ncbi:ABC transporter substrate-binding protein [Amycolatopsis umgeniensis]|uniref:Iron complex transport system substrate-binding protein n=1 Tax=Amycolatopsis umgeniensis TaxID=336628 RepID=A0A841AU91_9PSEU|nr:ABC transporter substrate-binding protein [Amycolatopsis umgeniensis]MBB5850513.1 iron complex transport system substrate-binding protein [Amycolatopsis umgeniensis]
MNRRRFAVVLAALALATASCSSPTPAPVAETGASAYPMKLASPFGESILDAAPVRVAVITSVDLDIALALGIKPVISATPAADLTEYEKAAIGKNGFGDIPSYASTDGTDFEAIAAADPDVILATSGWSLDTDYAKLAKIAPVVSYTGQDGLTKLTWKERLTIAGKALNKPAEAEKIVTDAKEALVDARTANPAFQGKTLSFIVVHPGQITYFNDPQSGSNLLFAELGFAGTKVASEFNADNSQVSLENLQKIDADVLLMAYPFGANGILSRTDLEANPLFGSLGAVKRGDYVVLDDAVPASIAYATPLSEPWVLSKILPELQRVTAG